MFSALKDKLKSALSVFSKKTEEVAEEKVVSPVVEEKVVTKSVKEVIPDKVKISEKKVEEKEETPAKKEEVKKGIHIKDSKVKEVSKKEEKGKKGKAQKLQDKKVKNEIKKTEKVVEDISEVKVAEEKIVPVEISVVKEEKKIVQTPKEAVAVPVKEEIIVEKIEAPAEEKKGFFGKLKSVFSKKEEVKSDVVEKKEEVVAETKAEQLDVPVTQKVVRKREEVVDVKKEKLKEESKEELQEEVSPEKKGFFSKVKESFTTRTISAEKFEDLFWDLELVLLENNVSVEVIEKIKIDLKKELVDKPLPFDVTSKILETLKRTLNEILSVEGVDVVQLAKSKENKPYIIAFFGINGAGKTTSIAKLTYYLQQQGLSVVLAACDTFRAAAIQQLEEHADRLNVKMIKQDYGSDAAAVAFDAIKYAQKSKVDVVLIDTAGRLHSNTNLMAELDKIIRVTKPDLKIFVGESITGNDCIEQAKQFSNLVNLDGVILTKADVDEKGGAPLSIAYTIKKPILFLGMGQEYKDLEKFDAKVMMGRLGL